MMSLEEKLASHPILLFDGVCNLCAASVQFIIKRDSKELLRFASLQSKNGQQLLKKFNLPQDDFNTMVFIEGNQAFTCSTAGLHITRWLNKPWPILYCFIVVPQGIRDIVYRWIAKNRYCWFGKKKICVLPTPDLKGRFLE